MREKSASWTLADDSELRKRLEATAEKIHSRAQTLQDDIEKLNSRTVKTNAKLGKSSAFTFITDWILLTFPF